MKEITEEELKNVESLLEEAEGINKDMRNDPGLKMMFEPPPAKGQCCDHCEQLLELIVEDLKDRATTIRAVEETYHAFVSAGKQLEYEAERLVEQFNKGSWRHDK